MASVPRPRFGLYVNWDGTNVGFFTIGVSKIGGTDTLGLSLGDPKFTGTYDDLSSNLESFRVARGQSDDLVDVEAGVGSIVVRDRAKLLNPANESSPLYDVMPDRLHPCKLVCTWQGVDYPLFTGWVRTHAFDPSVRLHTATLGAVDVFYWLNRPRPVIASTGVTTTGAIIGLLLDSAALTDPAIRALDTGDVVPDFEATGDLTALQHIGELLEVERGIVYADGGGVVRYLSRYHGSHDVEAWGYAPPATAGRGNRTFDAGIDDWASGGGSSIAWESADGFRTNGCLELTSPQSGYALNSPADAHYAVAPGNEIRAVVAIKTVGYSGNVNIAMQEFKGSAYQGYHHSTTVATSDADEWELLTGNTFTVTHPDTNRVRIVVYQAIVGTETLLVDDAEVQIKGGATAIVDTLSGAQPGLDFDRIVNTASVLKTGGVEQTALDQTSIENVGESAATPIESAYLVDDNQAASLADYIVQTGKDPLPPVRKVRIEAATEAQLLTILQTEIGDTATLTESQTGSGGTYRVTGVEYELDAQRRHLVGLFSLTRQDDVRPFVIGRSRIGGEDETFFYNGFESAILPSTTGSGGTAAQDPDERRVGTYSMRIAPAGSTYGRHETLTTWRPGAQYVLEAWLKVADRVGGTLNVDIFETSVIDLTGIKVTADQDWTFYSETFVYPSSGSGTAQVRCFADGTPTMSAWCDELRIRRVLTSNDRIAY